MTVAVRIPAPLRRMTQNQKDVEADGASVGEVLQDLERRFPGITASICSENGSIRPYVNVYLNEDDVRHLQGERTAVKNGDTISIIPTMAGG